MRFSVVPIFKGHWASLYLRQSRKPDWFTRAFFLLAAASGIVGYFFFKFELTAPTGVFTGIALMSGALVGAFTHLSTLRLKVTEWEEGRVPERVLDSLDETAAHLMAAVVVCVCDAAVLAIGLNIPTANQKMHPIPSALALSLSSYAFLLVLVMARRLYSAYVDMNNVTGRSSGFASTYR